MWCIVADNADDCWVYGLYMYRDAVEEATAKLRQENPDINYEVANFVGTPPATPISK